MSYRLTLVSDAVVHGGAEQFLANLVGELPEDVTASVLVVSVPLAEVVRAAAPDVRVASFKPSFRGVRAAILASEPDVVLINLPSFTSNRAAWIASLTLGIPIVVVDHAPTDGLTWRGKAVQRVMTGSRVTRVAVRQETARPSPAVGRPACRVRQVDPQRRARASLIARPENDPAVVGWMGRLDPVKGVDVLLHACVGMGQVHVAIAGDGPLRADLEYLSGSLGLRERVRFLGFMDPREFLACIDLLAITSHSEGLPLVLLEAMFAGIPAWQPPSAASRR